MQIVKLVLLDSLKCPFSNDRRHYLIFGQRHVENLIRKNDVKNVLKPEVVID